MNPYFVSNREISSTKEVDFTSLSDEITLVILGYLDSADICMVSQVCKSWKRLSQDEMLWKEMKGTFGVEGEIDFMKIFVGLDI